MARNFTSREFVMKVEVLVAATEDAKAHYRYERDERVTLVKRAGYWRNDRYSFRDDNGEASETTKKRYRHRRYSIAIKAS